jgi:hypothetical protein
MDIPSLWLTAGSNPEVWGRAGTYKAIPYDLLPPLGGSRDGSFTWLREAPPPQYGMSFEQLEEGEPEKLLRARVEEARRAGFTVPPEFVRFLTSEDLYGRVPSCTACYYDIGSRLVPIPDYDGPERLLRFMNDQQSIYLWYLLLEPRGKHRVVFARPEEEDYPRGKALDDAIVPRDLRKCAWSFEEFIKRFWIENTLWYAVNKGEKLGRELREYADAARAAAPKLEEPIRPG